MSRTIDVTCFHCGKLNHFPERIGFRDECESCGADVHVCKNCRFYDPKVYNECTEPSAEVVLEKERANRCDYFQSAGEKAVMKTAKDDLLSAAEALFKKKS
jgi:hypothetical protein